MTYGAIALTQLPGGLVTPGDHKPFTAHADTYFPLPSLTLGAPMIFLAGVTASSPGRVVGDLMDAAR